MENVEDVTSFKILDSWKHAADEMVTSLMKYSMYSINNEYIYIYCLFVIIIYTIILI